MTNLFNRSISTYFAYAELADRVNQHPSIGKLVIQDMGTRETTSCSPKAHEDEVHEALSVLSGNTVVTFDATSLLRLMQSHNIAKPKTVVDLKYEVRINTNGVVEPKEVNIGSFVFRYFGSEKYSSYIPNVELKAIRALFESIESGIDIKSSRQRGEHLWAMAKVESNGIPINVSQYKKLSENWTSLRENIINLLDEGGEFYSGTKLCPNKFTRYIKSEQICWPKDESGNYLTDQDTFKQHSQADPDLYRLSILRSIESALPVETLSVGDDSRNRFDLRPYASVTGRNQPSTHENIFGRPSWLRPLIQAPKGKTLIYIDWRQQEFGIAAAISGDLKMQQLYRSKDPYLEFAKQCKAIKPGFNESDRRRIREQFKTCSLGVMYGMGPKSLAQTAKIHLLNAEYLLEQHKRSFPTYWHWSENFINETLSTLKIESAFGWTRYIKGEDTQSSIVNYPIQSLGAELMRQVVTNLINLNVKVCATIHDAILIEVDHSDSDAVQNLAEETMKTVSKQLLNGFELSTDSQIFEHPDTFKIDKGTAVWALINQSLEEL